MTGGATPAPPPGETIPPDSPFFLAVSSQLSALSFASYRPVPCAPCAFCGYIAFILPSSASICVICGQSSPRLSAVARDGLAGPSAFGPQAACHRFRLPPGSSGHKRPPPPIGVPSNYLPAAPLRSAAASGPFPPACSGAVAAPGPASSGVHFPSLGPSADSERAERGKNCSVEMKRRTP